MSSKKDSTSLNQRIEEIYKQISEFGPYQLLIFVLVGITSLVPAIVGYSYSFYGAVPDHRCKIPGLDNDTYEIWGSWHQEQVEKYIPPAEKSQALKGPYDRCTLRVFQPNGSSTIEKCHQWVYSRKYFEETLMTEWDLVCDNTEQKSLFATLYFVGTYGVLLNGILSDKFGRKKAAYLFMIASAVLNVVLAILLSTDWKDHRDLQQILFGVLRLFCGIASNVYAVAVVIAVEICGPSKRVTAANFIYYLYIFGEFVVVFFAYFIRNYQHLVIAYSSILCSFVFYFWIVPESPRWLLTKGKYSEAFKVFRRIAKSNKKMIDCLDQFEFDEQKSSERKRVVVKENAVLPHDLPYQQQDEENQIGSDEKSGMVLDEQPEKAVSFFETVKILFKSKKLIVFSLVTLLNWLTNTMVYYGLSFNTTELVGDPYLNFTLSVIVEFLAILACSFTLDRFGRKIPYSLNMLVSGISLLVVQFIPKDLPFMVTVLALIGKFTISFTYNGIYIITAEMYPTVIRNSAVSICQTFARFGAVISPSIQTMGDKYWYPIPFIVYGGFATLSAISFVVLMPETRNKKLPDTIEDFVKE